MSEKKVNITKVLSTISNSKNGEAFDALFGGDIERAGNNADSAAKSVINTLAWYLNGDADAVAEVFATSALAELVANAGAIIIKTCASLKNGFAGSVALYGEEAEEAFAERPARKKEAEERLQIVHVEKWLSDNNVTVRINSMTNRIEINGYTARKLTRGNLANTLPVLAYDELQNSYKSASKDIISSYIQVIAEGSEYHPALEKLNSLPAWDGKDRFPELWKLMHIDEPTADNLFSQRLFKTWMRQSVAILHNGENGKYFGNLGVLTLSGGQGIGKTTLLRELAMEPEFFGESQRVDVMDKDTSRRCLEAWIVELGELDSTFKSDVAYLKGFITRAVDQYRLPYDRCDSEHPRLSSLAATVNGDQYLVDPTGNRRFWTIPLVEKMDTSEETGLRGFDFEPLWAQTIAEIKEMGVPYSKCFLLSDDDEQRLALRNNKAEKGLKGEAEVLDIILTGGDKSNWEWKTVSKFREDFINILRNYSSNQIGTVLRKMGIDCKKKKIAGTAVTAYLLPGSSVSYLPTMDSDVEDKAPNYGEYNNNNDDEDIPF